MSLEELQAEVGGYIEIVPSDYYKQSKWGRCTIYVNENSRFDEAPRNPHFAVLKDAIFGDTWDILGTALKEQVYVDQKEVA